MLVSATASSIISSSHLRQGSLAIGVEVRQDSIPILSGSLVEIFEVSGSTRCLTFDIEGSRIRTWNAQSRLGDAQRHWVC